MIMDQEIEIIKAKEQYQTIVKMIDQSAQEGRRIDLVESDLYKSILLLGRFLLQAFIKKQGAGDFGETFQQEGKELKRLEVKHERRYVSIFGELSIARTVYGKREKQKHELVPLDVRLGLPEGDFSYLLQSWAQQFCIQGSYEQARKSLESILGIGTSIRTLESMSQTMSTGVDPFRETQPCVPPEAEGELVVITSDGKGVPMRTSASHTPKTGEFSKNMSQATVGAIYTIAPFCRNSEDVVDEILRKQIKKNRPTPCHKILRAELSREYSGLEMNGKDIIFHWMAEEVKKRTHGNQKPVVCVMDGDRALWKKVKEYIPQAIGVLDLCHALGYLWKAAHCFHKEGSPAAKDFVEERLTQILQGKIGRVIGGLRQMKTKQKLSSTLEIQLSTVITYLENHRDYMRYDYYLSMGYPIGSGVVEGACRHLVKDRMELAGMRWRVPGAQAVLHLRSIFLNEEWEKYQDFRIEKEQHTLYPEKSKIAQEWPIAA